MRRWASVVVVALVVAACGGDDDDESSPSTTAASDTTSTTAGVTSAEDLCADDAEIEEIGTVEETALGEVSGIGASRRNPGVLWVHNDSGGGPDVYALAEDGATLGRFTLDGAEAFDWEDMALGPEHLYVGDIGDNASQRDEIVVYRVPEPTVDPSAPAGDQTLAGVESLTLTYEEGPHDAETLLADPVTGDLYVVSKQWDQKVSGLYRVPADAQPDTPVVMERVGDVTGTAGQMATAGDISADGSLVAVRTYNSILLWDRAPDQPLADALTTDPCEAPVPFEIQGEAITFTPDGTTYLTIPEGTTPTISRLTA
jgi:hypothetical protein